MKRLRLPTFLLLLVASASLWAAEPAANTSTKFFRVQSLGGTWWLINPDGQPTLSIGTDHVSFSSHWCEALGYALYARNVRRQYGTADAWAAVETARLKAWNFNVLGAGCSPETRHRGLAHTEFLAFGSDFSGTASLVTKTFWTGWPDVFDPRFEAFCDARARERCRADDPWLLGYFLDNELEWFGKQGKPWGIAAEASALPASAAGKKALVSNLRGDYKNDIVAFNRDFQTRYRDFDELLASTEPLLPRTGRGEEALNAFVAEAAARYFKITTAAVRRHDANHLILGCRFAHDAPDSAWQQAGKTCDIVAVNVYPRIDLLRQKTVGLEKHLRHCFARCGKPLILTEWSFPALDAVDSDGRPLPSQHGAGMRVDNQRQRAACFAIMQRDLFRLPFVVGSHYFMWMDEPSRGISKAFPEDSNYGLVSESDKPYTELTDTATRVNAQLIDLHAGRKQPKEIAVNNVVELSPPPAADAKASLRIEHNTNGYTIDTGLLRASKETASGKLFDHISWRAKPEDPWIELGSYDAVLEVRAYAVPRWPSATRVIGINVHKDKHSGSLDIVCACDEPPRWKAGYQLEFEAGRPWFLARCNWIENAGEQPLHVASYFHYLVPGIAGAGTRNVPGTAAPNYWLSVASWRDPVTRVHYGALSPLDDDRILNYFWRDVVPHPDCRRVVNCDLPPGKRWTADKDEPRVLIFGLREPESGPIPWSGMLPFVESGK